MKQPYLCKMMEHLDSKYALCVATAKRARMLTDGASPCVEPTTEENKAVSIAMREIAEGKIIIETPKGGLK